MEKENKVEDTTSSTNTAENEFKSSLDGSRPLVTKVKWEETFKTIDKVVDLSKEYMLKNYDRSEPIVRFKTPEELANIIDFTIGSQGVGLDGVMNDIKSTILYSVRTGHVRFMNQLWGGTDIPAVLGEWLTSLINGSMYTYEISPVFSIMEVRILEKLRKLIGWEEGKGDGVFAPGGAHCNLLAMLLARNNTVETVRMDGISSKMVCFTSADSHYTIQRAVGVVGVGEKNCIKIAVDSLGRMIPAELEKGIIKAKEEGKIPFMINATCGTTVLGSYDFLNEIAEIAKKYSIWSHIDACWGGHVLLSKKYRHLMNGCEKFDSIAWTGTKCLGLPQQCAALLVQHNQLLTKSNAMYKDYLFHEHEEKEWDLGEKSLNCGRRVDVFKLWISWKVVGDEGFEHRVNAAFERAKYVTFKLTQNNNFKLLILNPQSLNVCFWYIPPSARSLPEGDERDSLIDNATLTIRKRMQRDGKLLVNYSDLDGHKAHFFRLITCNPGSDYADIDFVVEEIDRLGSDL